MKNVVLFCGLLLFSTTALADTTRGGYVGCISENLYDQFNDASVKKDMNAVNYLLKHGCMGTKAGLKISVLDKSWETAKIRVYVGNNSIILWTSRKNIVK